MSFLSPIAALVAAAITLPLLTLLYFLKLRRRTMEVSSTLLWRKAIEDLQVNAPFQKLRRNLLLLLQLLILAGLLLAFARPTAMGLAGSGQRMVIVIDHSASMNATDVTPTRLDHAKNIALDLIERVSGQSGAGGDSGAMVISFARGGRVVQPFTTDRARLRSAIRSIEPTDQTTSLDQALQLIEPYTHQNDSDGATGDLAVFVLSDGKLSDDQSLSLSGAELRYVSIGSTTGQTSGDMDQANDAIDTGTDRTTTVDRDNLAIISFAARRDYDTPQNVEIVGRLANYNNKPIRSRATLTVDGRVHAIKAVEVNPYNTTESTPGQALVTFQLELASSALVQLTHDHQDLLAADDQAALVISSPRRWRVILVTPGNIFLDRALRGAQGVDDVVTLTPGRFDLRDPLSLRTGNGTDGIDLIVFDRYSPREMPNLPGIYFSAAPPMTGLKLLPTADRAGETGAKVQGFWSWRRDHPLLRHVTLDGVLFESAGRLALPDQAEVLGTGSSGPVLATVSHEDHAQILVGVDLVRSNWPLELTFPVFIDNAVQWLAPRTGGQDGIAYQAGEIVSLPPVGEIESITYANAEDRDTLEARIDDQRISVGPLERVGVYETSAAVRQPWDRLAVNLLDLNESDLAPADSLAVLVDPGKSTQGVVSLEREVWQWFVLAALGFMLIEWIVYARRMHL